MVKILIFIIFLSICFISKGFAEEISFTQKDATLITNQDVTPYPIYRRGNAGASSRGG